MLRCRLQLSFLWKGKAWIKMAAVRYRVRLQVDLNDIESSTILSFRYIVEMGDGLNGLDKRQALKDWLDLLSRSHPLNRCVIHPDCIPNVLIQCTTEAPAWRALPPAFMGLRNTESFPA